MRTLKYIMLGIIGLTFISCEDFFETKSPSTMDAAVYLSETKTEQVIAGIYDLFGQDRSYRNRLAAGYQGMNSDIEFNSKEGDYAIYNMSVTNSELSVATGKDPWGYMTSMIERANVAIEGIETYSDLTKPSFQYFLGEVLTLRAFVYLEMIKLWGDVPARFEPIGNNIYAPKTDRNIIFEQLRIDLKRAAELIPWSAECPGNAHNYTGRPSKAFVLGLLARNNMMYAGYALRPDQLVAGGNSSYGVQLNTTDAVLRTQLYQEALEACARVIQQEDFKFQVNYEDIFKAICTDNTTYSASEFIWELPFADGLRGQFMNYNSAKAESSTVNVLKNNGTSTQNSVQMIVPTLVYDYEENDIRREINIAPYTWTNDNGSSMVSDEAKREALFPGTPASSNRLYQKHQKISGFYLNKFRVEWMARERTGGDDGINYPVMRYTDILLMFAEASLGGITGDRPQNTTGIDPEVQFNRVRARAGLADKELNMQNLMDERKFEFVGEYIRKYDLMRWGKLKEKLTETMARIADLDAHTGEFEQTGDTIYFQYRQDNTLVSESSGLNGYIMTNVWGLKKGEVGRPAGFDTDNGWVAKNIFLSESAGRYLASYRLYYNEETLDSRHYWPIFLTNLGASNGSLWNDYGYPNN